MRATRTTFAAAATAAAIALAGCGGDDEQDATSGEHATSTTEPAMHGAPAAPHGGGAAEPDARGSGDTPAASDMGSMADLGSVQRGDMTIAVMASKPETFHVSEGDRLREQAPAAHDDAHLMVSLSDTESGIRLPDATVTARVVDAHGDTVFEGPLYPMIGRGAGMHYGENVDVGGAGEYTLTLTVGSPRVGRHRALADAWKGPQRVSLRVAYDGKALAPAP